MIDPEHYIKDGLVIVKKLIKEGSLNTAYSACQELLKVNPYHKKALSLVEEIEEKIIEANKKKVDADIDATMHLWDEKRYEDLLKIYTRLYQFAPNYKRLEHLIEKLNNNISEEQKNQRNEFIHKALSAIAGLLKEHHYADTIQVCNELLSFDPMNEEAKRYLNKGRKAIVEEKLKENERLSDSADFDRQLAFYESLLGIDPENQKVKRFVNQAKAGLAEQKVIAAKIELNESIARMKELFEHTEYEKVLQACEEIDRMDIGNFAAKLYQKKARAAIDDEIKRQTVTTLNNAWKNLAPEYQKNPGKFVTV